MLVIGFSSFSYLRRQKNIAEASCDATAAENSRLLLRIASLEEQINHLRTELNHERKASELATETTQRHSELMERVEQLNLVTESNRLLRHERETLRNSLTELEKQVSTSSILRMTTVFKFILSICGFALFSSEGQTEKLSLAVRIN